MQSSLPTLCLAGFAVAGMGTTQASGELLHWAPSVPTGDWNTAGNWVTSSGATWAGVPTSNDTVYLAGFTGQNGTYNITLAANGVAKNIGGDSSNVANLQYNINAGGNTLLLSNGSTIKTNVALYAGTFNNQTNGWLIGDGVAANTLTVGAGALLRPGGQTTTDPASGNMTIYDNAKVVVEDGGAVNFTRERTTWIFDGELHMAGGTFGGTRFLDAADASTIRFTLDNTNYASPAITVAWDILDLGDLAIELGSGYVHNFGEVFNLIDYNNGDYNEAGGNTAPGLYDAFNGLANGSSIFVDGNEFVLDYGANDNQGGVITLTAIPEPASLALLGLGGLVMLGRGRN